MRVKHLEAGLSNPLKDSWFISSTLRGIDRAKGTAVNRKSPISPDILLRIKKKLKMSDRDDIVFWAACFVMFFGLFRKANNLFAKQKFDANKHFTRDSFVLNADCTLTVQDHPVPGKRNQGHTTSPPPSPSVPRSFDKKLKAVTQGEGNLSGYSFRRGGACWALSQNIPWEIIKIMGDWKSTVYMLYLDQLPQPVLDYYRVVFFHALPRTCN